MRRKRKNQKRQRKAKKDEDTPTEVLSQDEIDQLLDAINSGYADPKEFKQAPSYRKIKIYDFKRPDKFSKKQIRNMDILHKTFACRASYILTRQFKIPVHIHVASVDQLTYEEFVRSVPTPTTLAVINLNPPMQKQAILEIDSAISFAFINKAFGGNEGCIREQHELTRLEWVIMDDVINCLLDSMRNGWAEIINLIPEISHKDTNPQFLKIVPPTEMTVLITLEVKIGNVEGMINIDYPGSCLEGIMDKLSRAFLRGSSDTFLKGYEIIPREDIPVELTAEIFSREYSIKSILRWKEEELLLPLRSHVPNTCYLRIGNKRVWYCKILEDKNWVPKKIRLIKLAEFSAESEGRMMIMNGGNSVVSEALAEAGITISAELGRTSMPVRDILSLEEGSIVELDKLAGEPVDIKANGVLIAKGEVVVIDDNFGIRVIEIAKTSSQTDESKETQEGL
jgi:flagellar motor switch protein FliM